LFTDIASVLFILTKSEVEFIVFYKTVLPLGLSRYEIWSLTLREEHRLRIFENGVLRIIFGTKRTQVTEGCRMWHNELHNLYSLPSIISMIKSGMLRWVVHVAWIGEMRNVYKILVGGLKRRGALERPRHKRDDNIKMNLMEIR
jgi:hypothetical protein